MITHKHFFLLRCTWQLVFEMPHAWFTLAVQVNGDALKLLDLSWCIAVCLQAFILALKWKMAYWMLIIILPEDLLP